MKQEPSRPRNRVHAHRRQHWGAAAALLIAALWGHAPLAQALDLAQVPLFLSPAVNPNVLVILDNSQSMDGAMAGKMLSGDDPATRSNVARNVLRDVIGSYRYSFNWGLGSFAIGTPERVNTYAYFLGNGSTDARTNDGTLAYTDTCDDIVDGVGVSDIRVPAGTLVRGVRTTVETSLPCVLNPERAINGYRGVTFSRSGDDPDVNDVTYLAPGYLVPFDFDQLYGIPSRTAMGDVSDLYILFGARQTDPPPPNGFGWGSNDFKYFQGRPPSVGATDSGWLFSARDWPRRLWLMRGWGYDNAITGLGTIDEPVVSSQVASTTEIAAEAAHFAQLNARLAPEDADPSSPSLKNAARYTPLTGALQTSRNYFEGSSGYTSPIGADTFTCQSNYVLLATDGNPTGKTDGTQYKPEDWSSLTGAAVVDVLAEITRLRSTNWSGKTTDVKTYVIGLGDIALNPTSITTLNEMALKGGTATAFLASDPAALSSAFKAVASDIKAKASASGAVGVSSGSWQTGSTLYQGKFSSGDWSGDLLAYAVASDGSLALPPTWAAADRLKSQLSARSERTIITYRPQTVVGGVPQEGRGVAFRWPADPLAPTAAELATAQITALNTSETGVVDGAGALRLEYLRGADTQEARKCPACAIPFRNRPTSVLGDIIDSAPYYVGPPSASYYDDFESAPYSAFAAAQRTRTPLLYVGANDGMLHGFDAATGDEKLAYVPNLVFSSLSALTSIPFAHRYNVDGTPAVGDVFYGGAWHTLLVAGLRGGGPGLYALDVTNPSDFTEGNAFNIARWEFSDPDMGYVFTPPMLVKTNNGRWSVISGNGYNNAGTGRGTLYVIDAETGTIVRRIRAGGATDNGLSGPAAIDVNGDGVVDVVYAGDLNGKLWKFDLSSADPEDWDLAVTGGVALFDAGAGKAITSRPDVTRSPKGGYVVVFGTGRYLTPSDPGSTVPQTVYGIWDKDGQAVEPVQLQEQIIEPVTVSAGGDTYRISTHRVGAPADGPIADDLPTVAPDTFYADKRGWFLDLPISGERIVADASIRSGRAIFTSIIPDTGDACAYGGSGWILEFDVFTGNRLDSATFDVDNSGTLNSGDYLVYSAGGGTSATNTSGWQTGGLPSKPAFIRFRDGTANSEIKYVNTSEGTVVKKREAAGAGGEGRVMWRVVQ